MTWRKLGELALKIDAILPVRNSPVGWVKCESRPRPRPHVPGSPLRSLRRSGDWETVDRVQALAKVWSLASPRKPERQFSRESRDRHSLARSLPWHIRTAQRGPPSNRGPAASWSLG